MGKPIRGGGSRKAIIRNKPTKPLKNSCLQTPNLEADSIPTGTNKGFSFQHILLTHKTLSFATPMMSEFSNVIPH